MLQRLAGTKITVNMMKSVSDQRIFLSSTLQHNWKMSMISVQTKSNAIAIGNKTVPRAITNFQPWNRKTLSFILRINLRRLISITQNLKQTQATIIKAQPKVVRGELANIEHNQKQYANRMHIESAVLRKLSKFQNPKLQAIVLELFDAVSI
jgi:hypothetical protein